ncbi:MAG: hypothetical protein AB8G77_28005 [Rhodothermales bacterium]
MNPASVVVGILFLALAAVVINLNPGLFTVTLGMFEVTATKGVICASAFGFGVLTGIVAMLTRDVPRMRRLRALEPDA